MASRELVLRPGNIFDLTAAEYDSPRHQRFYRLVATELFERIPPGLHNSSILEVGAGTGFATTQLKACFPQTRIVALEPSTEMLARGAAKTAGVEWINQTVLDMWVSFDLVVSVMSFQWLNHSEREKVIELAANGTLALALPVTGGPALKGNRILRKLIRDLGGVRGWAPHVRRPDAITALLQKHFRHVNCSSLNISEEFKGMDDLAHSLYVRGVLYALFEGQAERARKLLARVGDEPADFNWSIRLFVATNKSGTSD